MIFLYFALRWVPFEVAKPLLDINQYSVLSDYTKASETLVKSTREREDIEMNNSVEDSDSDSSVKGNDVSNILISLNGAKLRYKVISVSVLLVIHYSTHQVLNLC